MQVEILMVDDNRGDVVLVREAIETACLPYNLRIASDGIEAMEYLHGHGKYAGATRPDLIILDLKLPRKTGAEVMDELSMDYALKDIPIVILSSSLSELCVIESRKEHYHTCFVKPNTFDGYIKLVRTIESFRQTFEKETNQ